VFWIVARKFLVVTRVLLGCFYGIMDGCMDVAMQLIRFSGLLLGSQ